MDTSAVDQARTRLMESSTEFRKLASQHTNYERRLEELGSRRFPSMEEQIEETRLKKLKLILKDQMNEMVRSVESNYAPG
jgi:uncharacterized protein YdcH (DUF465 family)